MKKIKRIIREEYKRLNESMDFWIKDTEDTLPETTHDLSWTLRYDVLQKEYWDKLSPEAQEEYQAIRPSHVFNPDDGTDDVINFYVHGIPEQEVKRLVEVVKRVLPLYEVKLLNIDDSEAGRVIRFKVQLPDFNAAPRLNLSNDNALKLLQLLGFEFEEIDGGQYSVSDMERGIERAKYYMNEPDSGLVDKSHHDNSDQKNVFRHNLGKDQVSYYLEELQKIVEYAKKLGYDTINVA